ncbi:hypothetical protein BT69DRAFT_1355986 [Atractiella rhizophila]|nr:hypothetical protein BT69DRAFT_1355986 [Atractiella rhizophila]
MSLSPIRPSERLFSPVRWDSNDVFSSIFGYGSFEAQELEKGWIALQSGSMTDNRGYALPDVYVNSDAKAKGDLVKKSNEHEKCVAEITTATSSSPSHLQAQNITQIPPKLAFRITKRSTDKPSSSSAVAASTLATASSFSQLSSEPSSNTSAIDSGRETISKNTSDQSIATSIACPILAPASSSMLATPSSALAQELKVEGRGSEQSYRSVQTHNEVSMDTGNDSDREKNGGQDRDKEKGKRKGERGRSRSPPANRATSYTNYEVRSVSRGRRRDRSNSSESRKEKEKGKVWHKDGERETEMGDGEMLPPPLPFRPPKSNERKERENERDRPSPLSGSRSTASESRLRRRSASPATIRRPISFSTDLRRSPVPSRHPDIPYGRRPSPAPTAPVTRSVSSQRDGERRGRDWDRSSRRSPSAIDFIESTRPPSVEVPLQPTRRRTNHYPDTRSTAVWTADESSEDRSPQIDKGEEGIRCFPAAVACSSGSGRQGRRRRSLSPFERRRDDEDRGRAVDMEEYDPLRPSTSASSSASGPGFSKDLFSTPDQNRVSYSRRPSPPRTAPIAPSSSVRPAGWEGARGRAWPERVRVDDSETSLGSRFSPQFSSTATASAGKGTLRPITSPAQVNQPLSPRSLDINELLATYRPPNEDEDGRNNGEGNLDGSIGGVKMARDGSLVSRMSFRPSLSVENDELGLQNIHAKFPRYVIMPFSLRLPNVDDIRPSIWNIMDYFCCGYRIFTANESLLHLFSSSRGEARRRLFGGDGNWIDPARWIRLKKEHSGRQLAEGDKRRKLPPKPLHFWISRDFSRLQERTQFIIYVGYQNEIEAVIAAKFFSFKEFFQRREHSPGSVKSMMGDGREVESSQSRDNFWRIETDINGLVSFDLQIPGH